MPTPERAENARRHIIYAKALLEQTIEAQGTVEHQCEWFDSPHYPDTQECACGRMRGV